MHLEFQVICIRLFAAMFCGALLGIERERTEHAAGLRTHALVCVSSCLLMIVSAFGFTDAIQQGASQLDPSRVAAQVVSGIGFLGAGVIMFRQNSVSGLNTAASIWSSAAIGLACGGGLFGAAVLTVFILLMVQTVWRKFEHRFFFHSSTVTLTVRKRCIQDIEKVMDESGVRLKSLSMIVKGQDLTGPDDRREIKLILENAPQKSAVLLIEKLQLIDGVDKLEYEESGAKMVKAGEHAHRGSEESGAP